jgi:hypothetical protein
MWVAPFGLVWVVAVVGCSGRPMLLENVWARAAAADLHVAFTKAADAGNRAVMADTDEASKASAEEAAVATRETATRLDDLRRSLQEMGYTAEMAHLAQFSARFDEFRKLDEELLPLAVENTNLKAQRLSFVDGQQATDAFRAALASVVDGTQNSNAALAASRAESAVLRIQVLQARHISEASEEAMTGFERQMAAEAQAAKDALAALAASAPGAPRDIEAARIALDRFVAVNAEIVSLSRRNTNVHSLALSLGVKRMLTAECEDQLHAIEAALAERESRAVR